MDSKYERANSWSNVVIGSAIEVHRLKGPGLLESIYEKCLGRELQLRDVPSLGQMEVEIEYKGIKFSEPLKVDLYIDECLLVELKAVETILPIHKAQLFSYMKLLAAPIGLLLNFHEVTLKKGIYRMILPGAQS
jgi:GxxExxY protein